MTLRRYVCLCCDGKCGNGILRRLRPHQIYVCQSCVAFHHGLPALQANLQTLLQEFQARRRAEWLASPEATAQRILGK